MEKQETNNESVFIKQLRNHAKQLMVKEYDGNDDCQQYITLEDAIKIFESAEDALIAFGKWIGRG